MEDCLAIQTVENGNHFNKAVVEVPLYLQLRIESTRSESRGYLTNGLAVEPSELPVFACPSRLTAEQYWPIGHPALYQPDSRNEEAASHP